MLQKLQAYQNDPKLKNQMLVEVRKHRKADQIVQGTYGQKNGTWKGCAISCTLRSLAIIKGEELTTEYSQHSRYETDLGIPKELAMIEDVLFEEMSVKDSKTWPEKFLKAINPGADLSKVVAKFMIAEWEDKKIGLKNIKLKNIKEIQDNKEVYGWYEEVVALYRRDLESEANRASEDEYYQLYLKIDRAWARTGTGAWARTGAWAWARTGARTGAWAWTWAGAGARTGVAQYKKEIMMSANKLLEILSKER